jgi:Insertion element 4 transposase N-terminal
MTTVTRTVTVAKGIFAPGHLGELTQYLPFELVDDVLEQTRTVQRRLRDLPSRAGVYFVLALGMYPHLGYARVWAKLTAGLGGLDRPRTRRPARRQTAQHAHPAGRMGTARFLHPHRLRHLPVQHAASQHILDNRARPLTTRHCRRK